MSQLSHYFAVSLATTVTAGGLMLADRPLLPLLGAAPSTAPLTATLTAPSPAAPLAAPSAIAAAPAGTPAPAPYQYPDRTAVLNAQKTTAPTYTRRPVMLRDEVPAKSSFIAFRNQLRQAIQRRDRAALQAQSSSDIKLTFGRPMTLTALKLQDRNAPAWAHLERILQTCAPYNGGAGANMMACPSAFAVSQRQSSAASDQAASDQDVYVIGEQVPVRSEPIAAAPVIGTLSNEIVQALPLPVLRPLQNLSVQDLKQMNQWFSQSETATGWKYVSLPNGQKGFVSSRAAYAAIGYRALFAQDAKTKTWKMTAFLAGD